MTSQAGFFAQLPLPSLQLDQPAATAAAAGAESKSSADGKRGSVSGPAGAGPGDIGNQRKRVSFGEKVRLCAVSQPTSASAHSLLSPSLIRFLWLASVLRAWFAR